VYRRGSFTPRLLMNRHKTGGKIRCPSRAGGGAQRSESDCCAVSSAPGDGARVDTPMVLD
jgi:hypothetical protein